MHVDGSKRAFAKTASEHDHKDAWVANVIAPYKSGWIASLRPIDKRKKPGDFGTVGGKLDEGETALQAAKREANEEGWAIKGIHKKPIHIADSPKGKIVTFAASGASKLYGHKERDREVHQITVSIDELANSHTHNSFLKHVDPKNHKAFIGMNKKADAAGGEATQNIGADNVGIEPPPPPQTDQAMAHTTGQAAQQNIAMKHMSQQRKPQLPPRRIPHNWVPR
jgi:ADP-ribose pyrophosphatase YjhB (NUDIX family)